MQPLMERKVGTKIARLVYTTKADGDLSPSVVKPDALSRRRAQLVGHPWRSTRQVHSDRVIVATGPNEARPFADALVTEQANLVLAVHSGDCVPVGFVSDAGAVAVAHAGWKGLEVGVLESTVRSLRSIDSTVAIVAAVGPHIRAHCYEFSPAELDRLALRFGPQVRGVTAQASPAFDLSAAIASELDRLEVTVERWSLDCTSCAADDYWSHRARAESGRFALAAWLEDT